jgi:hypothetical protein
MSFEPVCPLSTRNSMERSSGTDRPLVLPQTDFARGRRRTPHGEAFEDEHNARK